MIEIAHFADKVRSLLAHETIYYRQQEGVKNDCLLYNVSKWKAICWKNRMPYGQKKKRTQTPF